MKLKTTLLPLLAFILSITFSHQLAAQCSGAQFEEKNGIVIIEGESLSTNSSWRKESSKSGYTGTGYLIWRGTQYFGAPGNGLIQTTVRINNPGKYRFAWRNSIGIIAPSNPSTEHNDSWLKFPNASKFYGEKSNGSRVYPGGSGQFPTAEGNTSGGWFKVYVNNLNWTWDTYTSDFDGHFIYAEFNSPGVYTIQISARSSGHIIDRMILHRVGSTSFGAATNTSLAQTFCDGSGTPPPPPPPPPPGENDPPTVNITNPSNGASFSVGSNVTVNLNSNDPDGSVTKHEIFVNGTRVDTDGTSYSPYVIQNIAQGSYAIRAKVTDNSGASAESTVNITVGGGGTPPPPPPPPPGGNNDPTVSITSPSNGQNFNVGSTVTVGASASDSDGSIVKYQVYVNNSLKDTDGSNYTPHKITNIAAGSYAIRVTVTDNDGATASSTVNITVGSGNPPPPPSGDNNPPTVTITSPNNGQNFSVGSTVTVGASASDSDGTITKHQVYVNDILVDTDPANYTPHKITNIAAGSYAIRVTVTDNDGATASSTVNITVGSGNPPPSGGNENPTVTITSPNNGQNFSAGSTVTVGVSASDSDGTITKHQIYVNDILVDTDPASFTPHKITNITTGSYAIRATVTDNDGATASATVNITVGSGGKSAIAYPNPVTQGNVNVKLPEEINGAAEYIIISASGTEVKRGVINTDSLSNDRLLQINSASMKNDGVYYLVIQANYDVYTVPIIKQ
ncbi:MAG: T9SS type A sorting domain-containing protein [Eudoraea sp.]|nr:T9SS type A sorting domain-containing protein [Eudoraea sp.]